MGNILNAVTPIASPIDFPAIAWCEDDEIGTPTSTSRENLSDDDEDDVIYSHRRDRYSFISRSKSRKRSLCSLESDSEDNISPYTSLPCSNNFSGLWGHFILPESDFSDNQSTNQQFQLLQCNKSLSWDQNLTFKLHPRSDLTSFVPTKRIRSVSNTFP